MSINSITTTSSQNLSLSSSSKTSDNLEYQAVLNEALNAQQKDSGTANLSMPNAQNGYQENQSLNYSYAQTTISFYQTSNVNASSLSTLLSQATNNEDATSSNGINATKASEYGYNVDDNGFFGSDFNKAAGLPSSFRVNIKMMEVAQKYSSVGTEHATPMQVLAQAWKVFQGVCGSKLNMDKDGYISTQDASNLPRGYTTTGGIFGKLLSVQNTGEEDMEAVYKNQIVNGESNNAFTTGVASLVYFDGNKQEFDKCTNNRLGADYGDNPPKDKIAVGQLFDVYFNQFVGGEADNYDFDVTRAKAFYNQLNSGQSFSDYVKNNSSQQDIANSLKYYGADYFTKLDDLAKYFKGLLTDSMLKIDGTSSVQ